MNLDKRYNVLKIPRLPDFMGDLDTILRNRMLSEAERENIFNKGKNKGYESGAADFALSGADQLFFTKEKNPQMCPFNNMDALCESEKTAPHIEKFL